MNDFGYFLWEDAPLTRSCTVTTNMTAQTGSSAIKQLEAVDIDKYVDYASFETAHFDFKRPIYVSGTNMAFISVEQSDNNGDLPQIDGEYPFIRLVPDSAYSGSGFSVKTFNENYTIRITVVDDEGTRRQTFAKTSDEWYDFPYSGLHSATIHFLKTRQNSFLKIIGYSLGHIRIFDEDDMIEEPEINSYFSLKNDSLEFNTLQLSIIDLDNKYVFSQGQKITYSNGTPYYIATAERQDYFVTITAYDFLSKMENSKFLGIIGDGSASGPEGYVFPYPRASEQIRNLCNDFNVSCSLNTSEFANDKFVFLDPMDKREALRQLCSGSCKCIKRDATGEGIKVFNPIGYTTIEAEFTPDNIVSVPSFSEEPELDKLTVNRTVKRINKSMFLKPVPERIGVIITPIYDPTSSAGVNNNIQYEKQQEYLSNHVVWQTETEVSIGETYHIQAEEASILRIGYIYRYTDTDWDIDEERYSKLKPSYITWNKLIDTDNEIKFRVTSINGDELIAMLVYNLVDTADNPVIYEEELETLRTFKAEELVIDDIQPFWISDVNNGMRNFLNFVEHGYAFNKTISFDSVLNANAGDRAMVIYEYNKTVIGWITKKTEHCNGIYSYEVVYN